MKMKMPEAFSYKKGIVVEKRLHRSGKKQCRHLFPLIISKPVPEELGENLQLDDGPFVPGIQNG